MPLIYSLTLGYHALATHGLQSPLRRKAFLHFFQTWERPPPPSPFSRHLGPGMCTEDKETGEQCIDSYYIGEKGKMLAPLRITMVLESVNTGECGGLAVSG